VGRVHWQIDLQQRSSAGLGSKVKSPAEVFHSLLHAEQAEAANPCCVEALAVILYREVELVWFLMDDDSHVARAGMPRGVLEGLLNNPVDARPVFVRQILRYVLGNHLHPHARASGDLTRLPMQSRHKTKVVKHGWPQQQRHIPQLSDAFIGKIPGGAQKLLRFLLVRRSDRSQIP
jgi:hypothetical protein